MQPRNYFRTVHPNTLLADFKSYKLCPYCNGIGEIKLNTENKMTIISKAEIELYKTQGRLEQLNLNKDYMNSDEYWKAYQELTERQSVLSSSLGLTKYIE